MSCCQICYRGVRHDVGNSFTGCVLGCNRCCLECDTCTLDSDTVKRYLLAIWGILSFILAVTGGILMIANYLILNKRNLIAGACIFGVAVGSWIIYGLGMGIYSMYSRYKHLHDHNSYTDLDL
jgi:hypothetical protein